MKKKLFKRVQAGLLTLVLIVGVLPTGLQPLTVHAATTVKTMNLNTDYLAPSNGSWDANDNKVYFGQYESNPTAFRHTEYCHFPRFQLHYFSTLNS